MKPIRRPTTVDLAVSSLRQSILAGTWNDRLPGTRTLADRLGVSPPTIQTALERLAEEGLIESAGERRAFRIATHISQSSHSSDNNEKKAILITHDDLGNLSATSRHVIEEFRNRSAKSKWTIEHRIVDFLHTRKSFLSLDFALDAPPGTPMIALYGRPALAEWALARHVPMMFLGGSLNDLPVGMTGVRSSSMAEIALRELTAAGHRRIMLPLCDRTDAFKDSICEATRTSIEAVGGTYVRSYHNPESPYLKPDITWRILESAFKTHAPTALVLLEWRELVISQCFLSRLHLRIPEDISIVLLNDQMEAEWFVPDLSRFIFPVRRLAKCLTRWLDTPEHPPTRSYPNADFHRGGTIMPIR